MGLVHIAHTPETLEIVAVVVGAALWSASQTLLEAVLWRRQSGFFPWLPSTASPDLCQGFVAPIVGFWV